MLDGVVVPGRGPVGARVMIVGERPGETEAQQGRPFAGRSGAEQQRYLSNEGFNVHSAYITNICKDYAEGNPDPTPADVARWTPTLQVELEKVNPRFVLAVGRFATRWFLGDVDMEAVHGIPHRSTRTSAVILPCYHPAYGFYDDDARALISYDYSRAVAAIRGRIPVEPPVDDYAGAECYIDVAGDDIEALVPADVEVLGIDTEGVPSDPWSIQVSAEPGCGYVLRSSVPDFARGIAHLQRAVDAGTVVAIHNGMYDLEMCRVMGLDLFDARLFDSMYAAYILRVEPQGLKPLAYRWTGMHMRSYAETVGSAGIDKQVAYLGRVLDQTWPEPEPRVEYSNDGTSRLYTPQRVERRVESILVDYYSGKVDKDGNPVDIPARWRKVDRDLRRMVERDLGPLPRGTLADIPLADAVRYSARDPDATLRLYHRLTPELRRRGLVDLMSAGMSVLPIFEQMQSSGMPASRSYFEALSARMWSEMTRLQSRISHRYYDGAPFNPASSDKVAALMRRRGLTGEKRSRITGKVSTGKKSIEHLRYVDDAIRDIIEWREHQKIRDAFCNPIIERISDSTGDDGTDIYPVRCTIKTTRVTSRRISASGPNLTAIPVRNELGREVRDGYIAPEGQVFGSWDLSQVEMRYAAQISRDPLLISLFKEKRDVHRETAARIFGLKLEDVREMEHRYPAKRAGFGVITNIQGAGLLDQLRMFGCKGWDEDSCDRLIEEWLNVYKGIKQFLSDCKDEVRIKGVVSDCWGMPRYLPGVWSSDRKVAAEAERAASSHKIQGGAQGMIQNSMAWLRPHVRAMQLAGDTVVWTLQIHDEIILRFDERLWPVLDALVVEALTQHHGVSNIIVPIEAKGSCAKTWGKLKG